MGMTMREIHRRHLERAGGNLESAENHVKTLVEHFDPERYPREAQAILLLLESMSMVKEDLNTLCESL